MEGKRHGAGMNMRRSVLWFQELVRSAQFEVSGPPSQLLLATQMWGNRNGSLSQSPLDSKSRRKVIHTIRERTKDSPVEEEGKVKANQLLYRWGERREGVTGGGDWDVEGRKVEVRWRQELETGGEMEQEQSKEETRLRWARSRKVIICGPCSLLQACPPEEKSLCSSLLLGGKGQCNEPDYSLVDDSLKGQSDSTSKCNRAERLSGPSLSCSGWNSLLCLLFQIVLLKAQVNAHQKCIRRMPCLPSCALAN